MGFESGFKKIEKHTPEKEASEKDLFLEIADRIREISQTGEKIGFGMTAEVFTSKTDPSVCYKIISKEHPVFRNSVHKEADLLTKACRIKSDIILPEPYYSIETDGPQIFEVLVMRRLEALSIEDIIKKNLPLPENFNFDEFFKEITKYFDKLHASNIYHRDLHWGNIMIEGETGRPCIIDFGMSREEYLSTENPYKITNSRGGEHFITDDMIRIREVRNELRKHIFQKSKVA